MLFQILKYILYQISYVEIVLLLLFIIIIIYYYYDYLLFTVLMVQDNQTSTVTF